jgi:hypothetical protein
MTGIALLFFLLTRCWYSLVGDVGPVLFVLMVFLQGAHGGLAFLGTVAEAGYVCVVDDNVWHRQRWNGLDASRGPCIPVCPRHNFRT